MVRYISNCSALVTAHSYWLSTHHLANDSGAAERRANTYIDKAVEGLRAHLFSLVPWHHYQALVDLFMAWLTQAVHQSKAIYRRSNSPPETVHHAHVLVRFVHLVVHPRLRCLDLSTLPKVLEDTNPKINLTYPQVLRDTLYRQLGHLTGLQKLHLGSGSGEAVMIDAKRKEGSFENLSGSPAWLHLSALPHLSHLPLPGQRLHQRHPGRGQTEKLSKSFCSIHFQVGQNCSLLRHLDICSSGAVTEQGAGEDIHITL